MRETREPIYELEKKIRFLLENPVVREVCGHNPNLNSFCNRTGISRSALRTVTEQHRDILSRPIQLELAKACHFGVDWAEWNDFGAHRNTPRDQRKDTAEQFVRRWLQEHPVLQEDRAPIPGQILAPIQIGQRDGKIAPITEKNAPLDATEEDFNAWREAIIHHVKELLASDFREGTNHGRCRDRLPLPPQDIPRTNIGSEGASVPDRL